MTIDSVEIIQGNENVVVIDGTNHTKVVAINLSKTPIIPTPIMSLHLDTFGYKQLAVTWHSNDLNFLNFSPKYYLLRYHGRGNVTKRKLRGFRHPVHQNGVGSIRSSWWTGASKDVNGDTFPPRNTEWVVNPLEGVLTDLDINVNDWVYTKELMPCELNFFRTRGAKSNNRHNAYFKVCIGIETVTPATVGCPVTFGPESEIFSLSPRWESGTKLAGNIKYSGWNFKIGM